MKIPRVVRLQSLIAKAIGVLFSVAGGKLLTVTSVGVEPTNAGCEPSTLTSDVLSRYITKHSQKWILK